ncbi:hypothetical protein DIT71_13475 [Marinobacter vulgaris]|uniref:DUF1206 domain-containing protein n=1 Tax=Marinobacter vulgaris TaxID=1928331 RepID=A0A2V3ZHA6_9GAMM|nr:hypothetical protein [Marinobacter vulgaris]PXX89537.1 hypothetical protein DIT71_13475 [Marinobacter vulgaris]TSJ68528.1 hypothetical protein FPC41_13470 [Marinobacter vulgaris]
MMRLWHALIVSGLLLGPMSTALGEDSDNTPEPADTSRIDAMEAALEAEDNQNGSRPLQAPAMISGELLDAEGLAAMQAALKGYYDYRTEGYDHRQRVFEWQLLSSRIIFVVVIALVGAGIYFSWLQFRADLKKTGNEGARGVSTLEASTSGIKVSSPVLGVVILVISLLFFYLYLQYVYPIEEIL